MTDFEFKDNGKNKEEARPQKEYDLRLKKKVFHHQRVVNELLKAIATCPMDTELKSILRMRVWGKNPNIFAPMTPLAISVDLKCKVEDVERWEEDAVHNVRQFLERSSMLDISKQFTTDKGIKDLVEPQKRIIV